MPFGRKIANRILLAALIPLVFLAAAGLLMVGLRGSHLRLGDYTAVMTAALILAAAVGWLLMRPLHARLEQLRRNAERFERGDYEAKLADSVQREGALREQNHALAGLNHRFEAVFNASNDGIAMLDREGRFVLVNRRFGEMLGSRPEALLQHSASEAQPALLERLAPTERLHCRLAALMPEDLPDPRGVSEEIIVLDEPDRRFLQIYTAPVAGEDGRETIGRIIALRDVTRERELDKMKTDFISVVSHELRTPLTSIKGYTDLLLSGAAGEVSEIQTEFLSIIQGSTTRLSNLINDILDISRIEAGGIDIKHEPMDYRRIVSDTLRLMKAAADEKQISMDASLPESIPPVRGDADKVMQVLGNLVSNAIKYTPPGGWIKVSLEVTGEASVMTCIADSGIGITSDDQKKLFQKFFRADNTSTREAGGTGLGLVIAKTIIELLGGAIWVESETGRGSRFYYTLPLYLETTGAAQLPVTLPERGIGLILIVDDDTYVRSLIRHALHRRGYGTLEAADGEEALQKARWHKPDAVTLDMMMPDMDGLRALRALKNDRATATIPIVLVSVFGDPSRGELAMGTFSFLRKPIRQDDLIASLTTALPDRSAAYNVAAVCLPETPICEDLTQAVPELEAAGIHLHLVESAPEAVAYVITEAPAMILLDTEMDDAELFALMTALKAEEEAARIPIVLLTDDISQEGIHFHVGTDASDNAVLLDYLCEQIGRAISVRQPPVK